MRNESAEEPEPEDLNEELVATRAALLDHTFAPPLNKDANGQIPPTGARLAELTAFRGRPGNPRAF